MLPHETETEFHIIETVYIPTAAANAMDSSPAH